MTDRTPAAGGLVDRGEFGKALNVVRWTREEKARGADKLGSWKCHEFVK